VAAAERADDRGGEPAVPKNGVSAHGCRRRRALIM
jgi:hypothetical protein